MKKFSFLALAAVGLLFGACASNDAIDDGAKGQDITDKGDQFVTLSINLPSTNQLATRTDTETDDNHYGDSNFELNDGLANEYDVKDAMLVIFRPAGSSEDDATFVGAYEISPDSWSTSSDQQVTRTSAKVVTKVGGAVQANDLALVILNRNNLVSLSGTTLKVAGADFAVGQTYKAFRETQQTAASLGAKEMTSNGFFMANAPLTDKKGSTSTELTGAKVRTLVPITQVFQTEAEAIAGEPDDIYVERGMAKVTVQGWTSMNLTTPATYSVSLDSWTIDQTNTKSYTVRSTESHENFLKLINPVAKKYRYAGMSEITEGAPATYKYRTYFAKDPNYDAPVVAATLTDATLTDYTSNIGDANPQYCFENTFDVANQNVMNTTLVRLKVKVGDGTDIYIVNENRASIYNNAGVVTLIRNACKDYIAAEVALGHITFSGTLEDADLTVTVPNTAGVVTPTVAQTSTLAPKVTSGTVTDAQLTTAVTAALKSIWCYKGGMSYYTIRIKHFGDQLTPWHTGNVLETPAPEVGNVYPGVSGTATEKEACAAAYLGRYGVLRNNWYDIRVNSIKYIGEPTPKDYSADPTTDDELDGYLSVKIHILSWAKRIQSWDI